MNTQHSLNTCIVKKEKKICLICVHTAHFIHNFYYKLANYAQYSGVGSKYKPIYSGRNYSLVGGTVYSANMLAEPQYTIMACSSIYGMLVKVEVAKNMNHKEMSRPLFISFIPQTTKLCPQCDNSVFIFFFNKVLYKHSSQPISHQRYDPYLSITPIS